MASPKSPEHQSLGAALRELRLGKKQTLESLGDSMKPAMNPRYISAVERGEINLSFGSLLKLCRALGVTPSEVLARAERAAPRRPSR